MHKYVEINGALREAYNFYSIQRNEQRYRYYYFAQLINYNIGTARSKRKPRSYTFYIITLCALVSLHNTHKSEFILKNSN